MTCEEAVPSCNCFSARSMARDISWFSRASGVEPGRNRRFLASGKSGEISGESFGSLFLLFGVLSKGICLLSAGISAVCMFLPRFISPFRSPQKYSYMEAEEISHEKSDTRKEQRISEVWKILRTRKRAEMLPQISRRRIFEGWRDDGGGVAWATPSRGARATAHKRMLSRCRLFEIISSDFSVNVKRIIKDDFINCSFNLFFIFLIRKAFRCFCNSCQVTTRIVTFFNVEQKPRSKLFKRIVGIVECG